MIDYYLLKRMYEHPQPDDWKIPVAILIVAGILYGFISALS